MAGFSSAVDTRVSHNGEIVTFRGPDKIDRALLAMREAFSFVLEPEATR